MHKPFAVALGGCQSYEGNNRCVANAIARKELSKKLIAEAGSGLVKVEEPVDEWQAELKRLGF